MPLHIQLLLQPPEVLKLPPKDYIALARKHNYGLTPHEKKQLDGFRERQRAKMYAHIVPMAQRGTIGGLHTWVNNRTRDSLVARGRFGPHAAYVIGQPHLQVNDDGSQSITVAVSTENLLLNAYRQSQIGLPQIVQVS